MSARGSHAARPPATRTTSTQDAPGSSPAADPARADDTGGQLGRAELGRLLRAREPQVMLVEERILRRVVREDRGILGFAGHVPHAHCYAAPAAIVRRVVEAAERDVDPADWTGLAYLIAVDDDELAERPRDESLLEGWRRLFHARVDGELRVRLDGVSLSRAKVLETIDRVGQTPFDEARAVLHDEGLIDEGAPAQTALCELVALYQETRYFAPELLRVTFPALAGRPDVAPIIDALVDARALFDATRPAGATIAKTHLVAERGPRFAVRDVSAARARRLLERAVLARERGDDSLAAILCARTQGVADEALATRAGALEQRALASLGRRLAAAVAAEGASGDAWRQALAPLTKLARAGMKRVEARLLHDLQRASDHAEHESFEVSLPRWLRTLGRSPLRRPLPCQRLVEIARDLRRASKRLPLTRLEPADRARLRKTLAVTVRAAETAVRVELGAKIVAAFTSAGLEPKNVPERVARDKVTAELLDRVLDSGFIAFGDVRDALARNELKLPDLASVKEFFVGDALLRVDRALDKSLDGVYRRGEIYRRALQRMSSLGFANAVGRFLVLYAILPFGGAYVIVSGIHHIAGPLIELATGHHPEILTDTLFLTIGVFLFLLLHVPPFRRGMAAFLRGIGHGFRFVFVTLPRAFRRLPPIRWLVKTPAFRRFRRAIWQPLVFASPIPLAVGLATWSLHWALWVGGPVFLLTAAFISSRVGRRFQEAVIDRVSRGWRHFRYNVIPGIVEGTLRFFKRVVELIEIGLYQVDQWLRFRRGESLLSLAVKAVAGFVWSVIAYLVRLYVNLLIEPQVNPIKHFPVVTVSHKIILPMSITLTELLSQPLAPLLGDVASKAVAGTTVVLLPGVFGFLVWEFKETWRLYAANRHKQLKAVRVGSHGETLYRLLRPGFHSGTVRKVFRKLRKAERKGLSAEVRKHSEALHHVEEAVAHFVTRELFALLAQSGRFPEAQALRVEKVDITTLHLGVVIGCPPLGEPVTVAFDEQARFLVASVPERGFLDALPAEAVDTFESALYGLYKRAGVDLVHEHIVSLLPGKPPFDVALEGLVAWPGKGFTTEVVYPLRQRTLLLEPRVSGPPPPFPFGPLAATDLFFAKRPLPWSTWVDTWALSDPPPPPLRVALGALPLLDDDSLGNADLELDTTPAPARV